ncbi:hypothetical protein [Massilia sp. CF038]|uniref:hypothetical protein n=1 Tax=Massilia sp. CF038 TaxID=1881045 RepID=UPI0009192752|nr:hypothetical protein [Massilia sp. CF038]SHG58765.1 hypothetical protein SAMN05428948_1156 [Massilia sp. CF038]
MDAVTQAQILDLGRQAHALTEAAYGAHPATRGQPSWPDKQRILLADMALHLLQTALRDGPIDSATLQNNLYSILTISAPFLPEKELVQHAQAIITP